MSLPPSRHLDDALLAMEQASPIWLGARYGWTPARPVDPDTCQRLLGEQLPGALPIETLTTRMYGRHGRDPALSRLAPLFAEVSAPHAASTLPELAGLGAMPGRVLFTLSPSHLLAPSLGGCPRVLTEARPATLSDPHRATLVMLAGDQTRPESLRLSRQELVSLHGSPLATQISALFTRPLVALGVEPELEMVLLNLYEQALHTAGPYPPRVYVVDPRPEEEVAPLWPRGPFCHVCCSPAEFLSLAAPIDRTVIDRTVIDRTVIDRTVNDRTVDPTADRTSLPVHRTTPPTTPRQVPSPWRWHIFLSHAGRDKHRVRLLAHELRQRGLEPWLDEEQIGPGDSITARIDEGLRHSRVVGVCVSRMLQGSNWCRAEYGAVLHDEISRGSGGDSPRVVPLIVDEWDPGRDMPLLLRDKRHLDMREADDLDELVRLLQAAP